MNAMIEQINSTGKTFVEFSAAMLIQSSILIGILLLVDLLLRNRVRAIFRYCIWMLVLVKLVLPSSISSPFSIGYLLGDKLANVSLSEPVDDTNPANVPPTIYIEPIEATSTVPIATLPMEESEPVMQEAVGPVEITTTPVTWQGAVLLVWAAVAAAMGLLLIQRAVLVCRLVRQAKESNNLMNDALEFCREQMGIKQKIGLKVSTNATSPAVCGLFRPVILLPQNLGPSLGARDLRAVLMHELAHIKRGDLWVNLAQTILQIIYFYNPLLWLANAIIRRVREQAVDEAVQVAMGEAAQQYPETLVNVAKLAFKRPALGLRLIGVVESKSALKGRIKRMLDRPIPKSAKLGLIGLIAITITAAVLLPMAKAKEKPADEMLTVLDSDGDGLSDFQEVHKYLTNPAEKDSDSDGINDGDWDERREYSYSVRTIMRYMPPFDEKALNDDFQDARVLSRTDDYIEIEVVHYPFSTAGDEIQENPNWQKDYAKMKEYIEPGITTNWDNKMRKDLLAQLKADGIDVKKLTDKEVVEKVSRWALNRAKSLDKVFTTYYVHFPKGRPEVYPGLEEAFEGEFKRDSENYDWTIDEHFEHEVFGKGMYYSRTRGSCTSTGVYLTTVLRAVGIPTRMIMVTPVVDASNEKQLQLVKDGITHNEVRTKALVGLGRSQSGFTDHVFNEVYIGNRWHRLNYTKLVQPILDIHCFGLHTHLYTFNDLSKAEFAPTWGYRYGKRIRDDIFGHSNPYTAVVVSDLFGKYCKIDNPSYSTAQLDSGQLPNIFIMEPSRTKDSHFSIWEEVLARVKDATYNKTGRNHKKEYYDDIFGEVHVRKPGDYLVMLFSLDTKERIPAEYEDMLPKPWTEIEAALSNAETVELVGQARDMNIILLAAQKREQLKQLVQQSKLLSIGPEPSETKIVSTGYKATLSNGVTVELVGTCQYTEDGVDCYRPDGTPLGRELRIAKRNQKPKAGDTGIMLKISGPEDISFSYHKIQGTKGWEGSQLLVDENGQELSGWETALTRFDNEQKTTSMTFGAAAGTWKTVAEHDGRRMGINNGISFTQATKTEKGVQIYTTDTLGRDVTQRIIAIDNNGKVHPWKGYTGSVSDSQIRQSIGTFPNLKLDQIEKFQFQTRPYEWVTFKNVSLRPGVKTAVEVEGEKVSDLKVFESYFPDDETAGKKLDEWWQKKDETPLEPEEFFALFRRGLRRCTVKYKGNFLMQHIGGKYIWRKKLDDERAVDIVYHASYSPEYKYYAVYSGLSVANPKSEKVLKRLVDLAMEYHQLSRIIWGVKQSNQGDEFMAFLEPDLQSSDSEKRERAEIVAKAYRGEIDAGKWEREWNQRQQIERTIREFGDDLPRIKKMFLTGTSKERLEAIKFVNRNLISLTFDQSFIRALGVCAQDSDANVRAGVAAILGSNYIWGKAVQPKEAIEVLLRVSQDENKQVRYNAVYFGLSVVKDKSPMILKRLAELCVNYEDTDTGRIVWAVRNEETQFMEFLKPYLNSTDPEIKKRAETIIAELKGGPAEEVEG